MKPYYIIACILFYMLSLQSGFAQVQTPVYDSVGIVVDLAKDLNDTLTAIPNTNAKIRLPRYFDSFSNGKVTGFLHKGTSTSIIVYEYPGTPFTALTNSITDSVFIKQGAVLLETLQLKARNETPAIAYVIRFQTKTAPVIRIMYFTGNYQTTYYLIANIPEVVSTLIRNVILESFKTLEY
jgi:hypothetical protein